MEAKITLKLPETLAPESVFCVVDSREQAPLDLAPFRTIKGILSTGDYAMSGCDEIRIERKYLATWFNALGTNVSDSRGSITAAT